MTEIEIDFSKSLEENASLYFESGKKARAKAKRISEAIARTEARLSKEESRKGEGKETVFRKRKKAWYEKFHWFVSSDGFLVIGGRDAKSNEEVVKKHMEHSDLYFHADIQGAPHCIVKSEGKKIPETTKQEAAVFAAVFSKAWPSGIASADVYSVKPEQVSKKAPSKEAIGTGAFMIYGKRQWYRKVQMRAALGVDKQNRVISGPESAVGKHSSVNAVLVQGRKKKGETAKSLKALFENELGRTGIHLDEFIAMLPAGNSEIMGKP